MLVAVAVALSILRIMPVREVLAAAVTVHFHPMARTDLMASAAVAVVRTSIWQHRLLVQAATAAMASSS
jgi:hypothetical protein